MEYNKESHKVTKSRTVRGGSGPRDLQRRQKEVHDLGAITELRDQMTKLTQQISAVPTQHTSPTTDKIYSAEDFDSELNKVILQVTTEMENKHAATIKQLREEVNSLKRTLDQSKEGIVVSSGMSDSEVNEAINDAVKQVMSEAEQKTKTLVTKSEALNNQLRSAEDKVIELKKQVTLYEPKVDEVDKLRTTLEVTKAQLVTDKSREEELKVLREELSDVKTELAVANSKIESKDELIQAKEDAIANLKDRPVNLNVSGTTSMVDIDEDSDRPKMEQVFIDPTETEKELSPHLKFKDVRLEEKEVMSNKVDKLKSLLGGLPK